MKKITTLVLITFSLSAFAQIKGKITDAKNNPLSFVSIYLEGTVTGTTSNESGAYELPFTKTGKHTIVFQMLGFKTVKKQVDIQSFPYTLDAKLYEEQVTLDEVTINANENPAIAIIRSAIDSRDKNTDKLATYTAKFYSRGLFKIKNAPKKFLGQEIGDLGGGLDSTRSGIIYLSETISEIANQKPNNFKEKIIASKVSGMDNGISFNRAADVNFDFYKNTFNIADSELISPISSYAFSYYNYKLEGTLYDKHGKLVNKIKIIPKRENDRVFKGFIYITEDDWAVYGADVTVTGAQINNPAIDKLHIKQNYNYVPTHKAWALISQTIDFKVGMLGFNFNGRFSSAYSNYNFTPEFTRATFGNEILSFAPNATKKDSSFWKKLRPVPLTTEEVNDYQVKDSIKIVRKSKKYLDSVDTKRNKPSFLTPLTGYTYRNSYKKWRLSINSPLDGLNFNTVQGWNTSIGGSFFKRLNDKGKWYNIGANFNYGFSDKRLRPTAFFNYKWNNIARPILSISGGTTVTQFNANNPISKFYNTLSSIIDERNHMKIYEKTFARVSFSREVSNGVRMNTSLEFADKKPLFNTTNYVMFPKDNRDYTSNNPQDPTNFTSSFTPHQVWTFRLGANIRFGNKYLSYPDSKFNITDNRFPSLYLGYRKTFGVSNGQLGTDLVYGQLRQQFSLGNWGSSAYRIHGGFFLSEKNIPFTDYVHFSGNRLPVASSSSHINRFNSLPYYAYSTNGKYAEMHAEHNFKGFILNKIPLINKLNFHTVIGAKGLFTKQTPYSEFSVGIDNIGWGKWRFLRVDYVRSYFNGQKENRFVFGISLFD